MIYDLQNPKAQIREVLCVGAFRRGKNTAFTKEKKKKKILSCSRQKIRTWMRCCAIFSFCFGGFFKMLTGLRVLTEIWIKEASYNSGRCRQAGSIPLWEWDDGEICQMLLSKSLNSALSDKFLKMKWTDICSPFLLQQFYWTVIAVWLPSAGLYLTAMPKVHSFISMLFCKNFCSFSCTLSSGFSQT